MSRALNSALAVCFLAGCECDSLVLPDASLPDAPIDAAFAPDVTAADAGRDARAATDVNMPDAFSPDDAFAPDAFVPTDAGFDCTTCRAALPCETLSCVTSCEYIPSANGTSCGGDDSVCVDASCVMRRCGDGWRENGSSSSPVEGCDDGNTTAGDGCDAMCAAEAVLVHTTPMRSIRASWGRPASAVDDLGNTLVTWAEFDFANYYMMARRYDRHGAPIDATPVMLGVSPSVSNTPLPTAQGLPSGWVISWPAWMLDPDMEGQGIAYAMVPISGAIPAPRLVNEGDTNANQHDPSIARLSSGFVIAWSSNQAPRQNIAIRYFNMDGTPRGPLSHPRPVDMAVREGLAIATSRGGDAWTLTYSEGFATSTVQAIEYSGTTGGAPYTIRYGDSAPMVFARGDTGTAMALVQDSRAGLVLIRHLADGMRPADDSGLQIFGDGQLDVQLGLASLGGSEWLAIWSRPSLSSGDRFAVQLSAGATRPPGLDRMVEHLRSLPIPSDFSMGRVSDNLRDGWIVTYTGGNRLYTTRLVP
jgi:cysteine-rich repeat protein